MVIHHIEHYADTSLMKGLHHLLEFLDTDSRIIRIGGIRAIGHIVVHRVVSPIVLCFVQTAFVYRCIVIRRKDMYMVHTQFLQMVYTGLFSFCTLGTFFSHSKEFTLVVDARQCIDGEIAVMHFVNHHIGKIIQSGTYIFRPTFRIGSIKVEDSSTTSVYPNSFGHDARRIAQPFAVYLYIKSIKFTVQVFLYGGCPGTVFSFFHRKCLIGRAFVT